MSSSDDTVISALWPLASTKLVILGLVLWMILDLIKDPEDILTEQDYIDWLGYVPEYRKNFFAVRKQKLQKRVARRKKFFGIFVRRIR